MKIEEIEAVVVDYIAKKLGVKWGLVKGNTYRLGDDVLSVTYRGDTIVYRSCDGDAVQEFADMQPQLIRRAVAAARRRKRAPEVQKAEYPLTGCGGVIHRAVFNWRGREFWKE